MLTRILSTSKRSLLSLLGLPLAMILTMAMAGCSNMPSIGAPDTAPIYSQNQPTDNQNNDIKCPPYNPEQTMCTAQYDPVCVKVKNGSTISYRTAGNACSACGTTTAISYTQGQCS